MLNMKWILIILLVLLAIPIVSAIDMCEEVIKPNATCKMVTPVINCTTYTYKIINVNTSVIATEGNLTLLEDGKYYLNFSEGNGQYVIHLCDGTTGQILVERREDNMLAIAIGLIATIIAFAILGLLAKDLPIKVYGFSIATIQLILLAFIMYLNELEQTLVPILRTDFYAIFLSAGAMGLIALVRYWIRLMDIGDNMQTEEESKWGRKKWQ